MDSEAPLPLRTEKGELSSRCTSKCSGEIEFSAALDPFDICEINGDRMLARGETCPFLLISNRESRGFIGSCQRFGNVHAYIYILSNKKNYNYENIGKFLTNKDLRNLNRKAPTSTQTHAHTHTSIRQCHDLLRN